MSLPSVESLPGGSSRRQFLKSGAFSLAGLGWLGAALPGKVYAESPKGASPTRNVIFLVSDGMSPGVLPLAEAFSQQVRHRGTHWQSLAQHPEATCGWMDTASANSLVTDSAAASSAWGCGVRVNNGVLNISPSGEVLVPLGPRFRAAGKGFGLVTTTTVTHATPAGFAVADPSRKDQEGIAVKYLGLADVYLGGGTRYFDPSMREDGHDLLSEFSDKGYRLLRSRDELLSAETSGRPERILGLFDKESLPYTIDRQASEKLSASIPTLAEMTTVALRQLVQHPGGFLLQVEGARIDHAAHHNDIAALLWDQLDFDDALGVALEFAHQREDTLIVVTSDHGNANPGLNGMGLSYSSSSECFQRVAEARSSFFALLLETKRLLEADPGLTPDQWSSSMASALGLWPSPKEARTLLRAIREESVGDWSAQQSNYWGILGQVTGNHTGIGWTGITHTADPTLTNAWGPGSREFHGAFRNDSVFGKICALCGVVA